MGLLELNSIILHNIKAVNVHLLQCTLVNITPVILFTVHFIYLIYFLHPVHCPCILYV